MIYPSNFEQRVGFDRIREQVMELCSMMSAREIIAQEGFSRSRRDIEERLTLADEMRLVISMESGADIGEQDDIRAIVEKVAVEGEEKPLTYVQLTDDGINFVQGEDE